MILGFHTSSHGVNGVGCRPKKDALRALRMHWRPAAPSRVLDALLPTARGPER